MARLWLFAFALAVAGAGCYTAYVVNPDVPGRHGEHFLKLQCGEKEQCLELARKTCGGDFEVESTDTTSSGFGHAPPGTSYVMLVRCATATPPAAVPAAPKSGG